MNDKIIINTISKIYFIIISFLSFIFLTLSVVFVLLQNGIYIDDLSLPNLKIKKLYIKWNKNINVTIDEINIHKKQTSSKPLDLTEINSYFKKINLFNNWFEQIIINKITLNDISASFKYIHGHDGYLNIFSKDFILKSSLFFESNLFNIKIDEFHDYKRKIDIDGNIIFNSFAPELTTSLNVTINKEVFLNIVADAGTQKLFYKINALKDIKSIVYTADLFKLHPKVRYWIVDAIDTKSITLNSAHGWLEYKNLSQAYKNIYANATLKQLNYKYDQKLDAIHTKETVLEFKDGVLNINPHAAYTYGFFLDKSWLKIDFTKKEELLTLYLMFEGVVNKDLLYLLNRYKIKLPILQNSGVVDTHLTLTVNLRTIAIDAHGDFFTKKANFRYLGLDIDVVDAYIELDNFDVKIKNMLSKYKDIATAKVDVNFNAKHTTGTIDFKVEDINFKEAGISMVKQKKPLNISYHISPKQDTIQTEKSTWNFNDQILTIDPTKILFDLKTLNAKIPTTLVKVKDMATTYMSGELFLKPLRIDLNVDLLKFSYNKIKLKQSSTLLKVSYKDNNIEIDTQDDIRLSFSEFAPIISDTSIQINNKQIYLKKCNLLFENKANINANGYYNTHTKKGYLNFKKLDILDDGIKKVIKNQKELSLLINNTNNQTKISIEKLNINYILSEKWWKLELNSLASLVKKSKLLKKYHLNNGKVSLFKNKADNNISVSANIKYPYKLLIKDNTPIENYSIKGDIDTQTNDISLKINNIIDVNIDKNIKVKADNIGININALLDYFNDQNSTTTSSSNQNIFLNLTHSHLWISKIRHVISDDIELQYFNNITTAQLKYKEGLAGFKFENKKFHLYGEGFNDVFMENLFSLSRFRGGDLAFSMSGTTTDYDGIFYIHNTTILEYKLLNNILAFVNTIPSLVTFSLPGYNRDGLAVQSAYADFHSANDTIKFKNIYLHSQEMDIVGRGEVSFPKDNIDLTLNLKTDLGSSVNKIPVVGYILLGNDTVSTSLSIKGKLSDPKVKSLIAKDIIVAPLNIIKRTLYTPFNLLNTTKKKK